MSQVVIQKGVAHGMRIECRGGKISYGLYLWHIAVFWMLGRVRAVPGEWYWPAAVGVTFALAAVSFYALERPMLRLKRRFERVPSGTPAR